MQRKWFKPIGAAAIAAGLVVAYAQTPAAPGHRAFNRQEMQQRRFDRLSTYLNLTDAQKTQAKAILDEAHQNAQQFTAQLKQNRQALAAAIKADNTADIDRLAAEQGTLMGKMIAVRTEAFAKIYQTLTPDQRAKADQLPQHFHQMMMQHRRQS